MTAYQSLSNQRATCQSVWLLFTNPGLIYCNWDTWTHSKLKSCDFINFSTKETKKAVCDESWYRQLSSTFIWELLSVHLKVVKMVGLLMFKPTVYIIFWWGWSGLRLQSMCLGITPLLVFSCFLSSRCLYLNLNNRIASGSLMFCILCSVCVSLSNFCCTSSNVLTCNVMLVLVFRAVHKRTNVSI